MTGTYSVLGFPKKKIRKDQIFGFRLFLEIFCLLTIGPKDVHGFLTSTFLFTAKSAFG